MPHRRLLFLLFFLSGLSGLIYQVVWLRLAFAEFGVVTPVVSVVISVFMAGLSLGSWISGKWGCGFSARTRISPILLYGCAELAIGLGAFAVPREFKLFANLLLRSGEMDSVRYLFASGGAILLSLLPWCMFMGMTFPLMLAFIRRGKEEQSSGFSYLYLANVIGAMVGTALTALILVETLGFTKTLMVAAGSNLTISLACLWIYSTDRFIPSSETPEAPGRTPDFASRPARAGVFAILFITGACSMAMEVVWTRAFTPITQTTIYAFAFLLCIYLMATWVGSYIYRRRLALGRVTDAGELLLWIAAAAFLPLLLNDPRLTPTVYHIFFSLFPICALLGYLTPSLIDSYSTCRPDLVGSAYGVNVLGCILGPLIAGYLLLPTVGVKWSLILLAAPFALAALACGSVREIPRRKVLLAGIAILAFVSLGARSFEYRSPTSHDEVRRDHTATVISDGEGMYKHLLVNGVGITVLTPVTKIMAHFPLALQEQKPESALVICFGMGTTFRALTSWAIDTTAVELVPSVKDAFGYYFKDAAEVMRRPGAHVIIDDGRRYLRRVYRQYDVITLDPPPPVEAAGSSLLYSREFYDLVKARLKPSGILQQWFPGGEAEILHSMTRAITDAFPYVRVYHSVENWGYHFIASKSPLPVPDPGTLVSHMPKQAVADMMEWFPGKTPSEIYREILSHEMTIPEATGKNPVPMLSDDRPFNEYFLLRRAEVVVGRKAVEDAK